MMLAAIALASFVSASAANTCTPSVDSGACELEGGSGGSIMLQRRESRNGNGLHSWQPATDMDEGIALANEKVIVATVDTRGGATHQLTGPHGWGNYTVLNVGVGKKWEGYKTKIEIMKEYVSGLPDDLLLVFVDGGDMMYGGCDLNDLVDRYHKIADATKAPIIAGAENYNYEGPRDPWDDGPKYLHGDSYPEHGRNESLSMAGLTRKMVDDWQQPDGGGYKHLNSGWIMGPVGKFREFYDEVLAFGIKYTEFKQANNGDIGTDQHWVQQMLYERPDLVGVDYTTLLVNNLGSTKDGMKLERDGLNLFQYHSDTEKWMSELTHQPVCFIHFNGCCQEKQDMYNKVVESGGFSVTDDTRPK